MTKLPETVQALIQGLRIGPHGGIAIHGHTYYPDTDANGQQLADNLASCIYHLAYVQAAPAPPGPDIDLSAHIQQANSGRSRIEHDWVLAEHLPDHAILAGRHGKTQRFQPGQFFAPAGDYPYAPGSPIMVRQDSGSRTQQEGFYYCFGDGRQEPNDKSPIVRLYWNVRLPQLAMFVRLLTATLNRYQIPFHFKITSRSRDFNRADNAVLYIAERWFRVTALALESSLPYLTTALDQQVPLFTKRLAAGIGFAEDPGNGQSFGSSRCKLVAAAILGARRADEAIAVADVDSQFRQLIDQAGLRADALYLNPGSQDRYDFLPQGQSTT
jgi:hypothetical protein